MTEIFGFKTTLGSIYRYDMSKGISTRYKVPEGPDQGWCPPLMCLFVDADNFNHAGISASMTGIPKRDVRIRPGYFDGKMINTFAGQIAIPEGSKPIVFFTNRNKPTDPALAMIAAEKLPKVGLSPFEKALLANNTSLTHIGDPVTEIFTDKATFERALNAAIQRVEAGKHKPTVEM